TTGKFSSGEFLEADTFADQGDIHTTPGTQDSLKTPIPENPRAASFRISKGTLRLFDVKTGTLLWEKSVSVKVPYNLQSDIANEAVARDYWAALAKSGAFPK